MAKRQYPLSIDVTLWHGLQQLLQASLSGHHKLSIAVGENADDETGLSSCRIPLILCTKSKNIPPGLAIRPILCKFDLQNVLDSHRACHV